MEKISTLFNYILLLPPVINYKYADIYNVNTWL